MGALAKLHKVVKMDPTVLDAETVLKMATVGSAGALGQDDRIGGDRAGF